MILNEFFNLPQVFEKDMAENKKTLAIGQQMAQDGIVYDHNKEDQLIGIMGEYMERNGMTPKQIRYYLSYDEDFVPDQLSYLPKNGDDAETFVQSEYVPRGREEEMDEGIFGSKPSPVLPIVAKIDKVARELNPQNVEVGKQIIQANARDITRMLNPQDRAGVDVIEQDELEEVDRRGFLKGVGAAAVAGTAGGANAFDFGKKNNEKKFEDFITEPADKEKYLGLHKKAKQLYTAMAINPSLRAAAYVEIAAFKTFKKQMAEKYKISDNLDEQGVSEAKDDYVPPREANYGKKYQDMVLRVGEKARAQEKAKQQPKQPVRESRLALLKQIIQS